MQPARCHTPRQDIVACIPFHRRPANGVRHNIPAHVPTPPLPSTPVCPGLLTLALTLPPHHPPPPPTPPTETLALPPQLSQLVPFFNSVSTPQSVPHHETSLPPPSSCSIQPLSPPHPENEHETTHRDKTHNLPPFIIHPRHVLRL